jgi:hypothetical protein
MLISELLQQSAANGFRKAGLYPCNRNIFRQNDFPFSDATEPSKDIPSLIVDPVRPGTSKEFYPVPVRAADIKPVPPYLSRQEAPAPGLDLLRPSPALPTSWILSIQKEGGGSAEDTMECRAKETAEGIKAEANKPATIKARQL